MILASRNFILVFLITAFFDLALNLLPPPFGAVLMRDYFDQHTVLAAALIAGFIGAFTLPVVALFTRINKPSTHSIIVIFLVSALIGFPMEKSGIFPHLNVHYYDALPRHQSFLADGLSGLIVAQTYWLINSSISAQAGARLLVFWAMIAVAYFWLANVGFVITSKVALPTKFDVEIADGFASVHNVDEPLL